MKIFLDTADVTAIRRAADAGLIDGVTTNPSLMLEAAEGRDPGEHFLEICEAVDGPVSAEVVGLDKETMVREG
ncbi:MAG TPA: transaldolase family protein, partial [Longimicrobiales bacterium]|nr:transaldolase family protein [Longimicrobiales bacterium]